MDASHHMAAVRELDLSACGASSLADRINAVPGLKTSTAFFSFLRDNLVLNPSAMSSNTSTPYLAPSSSQTLPPPSPSPLAAHPPLEPPPDDVPPLSLEVLAARGDKVEALRLVADSIAQQRQQAALALVFHPLCLAALVAALGLAYRYAQHVGRSRYGGAGAGDGDLGLVMTLCCGVAMTYLLAIRYATSAYIRHAEALGWSFLRRPSSAAAAADDDAEEDLVLGTRFGDDMIGALVLRLEPAPGRRGGKGARSLRGGRGVIRAWTTRLKYRGRGVGGDLLAEAVRLTRERCGRDAEVGFAQEHANSTMVLPAMFNGVFRKRERRAAQALENVLAELDGTRRKR